MGRVLEQIATSPNFQTPMQIASVWRDAQAREGLQALLMQREKFRSQFTPAGMQANGAIDFASMRAIDPSVGANATREVMARLQSAGLLDLQRQAIEAQNEVTKNLKSYNEQILAVTKATNQFEKWLGSTALWAPSIAATGLGSGAGALAGGLLAGGGGAGGAGGGLMIGGFGPGAIAALAGAFTIGYGAATAAGADKWAEDAIKFWAGDDRQTTREVGKRPTFAPAEWLADLGWGRDLMEGVVTKGKSELQVDVNLHDNRTEVKTSVRSDEYSKVKVGSGVLLPGAL